MIVKEIIQRSDFDSLESEWRALEDASSSATVFQSWAWTRAWLDHLGRKAQLRVLLFLDWNRLAGIAPLAIRRSYGTPFRRLQWIGCGVSDYHDILARPGDEAAISQAFGSYLQSSANRAWDVVDLHQIREDSPTFRFFSENSETKSKESQLKAIVIRQATCPYRPLPGSIEEFQTQLGKKLRGNLRYAQRVLERDRAVDYVVADESQADQEMTRFFQLHAMRWRTRWQPGVLFGRSVQAFHRQAAKELQKDGALRLHALKLDGETVASLYCFSYNGTGSYYLSGFDPALSRNSVGTLLTAQAMESALLEGCREFDFLRGMEPYKYRWGCLNRSNYRAIIPGKGALAFASKRALLWEQRIADRYEEKAHGGGKSSSTKESAK